MNQKQVKISGVTLINFRNHSNLSVQFDDLNVLIGENGGGKTSILEAICYALFGTVASGAKKSELVKYGEKSGGVTLFLSNGYKVVRDFASGIKLIDDKNNIVTEKASDVESYFNIDKNVFLNILYASQNDIYSYFTKFNAKEKDFIDSMFNLDSLTEGIAESIKSSAEQTTLRYNELRKRLDTRLTIESTINEILENFKVGSVEDLERAVKIAYDNLDDVTKKQRNFSMKQQSENSKAQLLAAIRTVKERIEQVSSQRDNLKLKELKESLDKCISDYSASLGFPINSDNLESAYDYLDKSCNIKTHLEYIQNLAAQGKQHVNNPDHMVQFLDAIYARVDLIGRLDEYRTYYSSIKRDIDSHVNNYSYARVTFESAEKELSRLNQQLEQYEESVDKIGREIDAFDTSNMGDIDQFFGMVKYYQSKYTELNSTLMNIKSCMKQLDTIEDVNDSELGRLKKASEMLDSISPIFGRDGFVSYLRKSLLKEIATNIGNQLEKFGFMNLLPVSIDEKDGALTFNNRLFRSLSGGEKTITAILLRVLYAKLLAPSMRLNLLLLDEATADLDSIRVGYLRQLLININDVFGTQIIMVTHDEQVIPETANKININLDF